MRCRNKNYEFACDDNNSKSLSSTSDIASFLIDEPIGIAVLVCSSLCFFTGFLAICHFLFFREKIDPSRFVPDPHKIGVLPHNNKLGPVN